MQDNQREEIAYLAGLFDGEGSIMIQCLNSLNYMDKSRRKTPGFVVGMRIGMINEDVIAYFANFFNIPYDKEKKYHHKRPMFRVQIRRQDKVREIIKAFTPYLKVKREQAKIALEYLDTCLRPRRKGELSAVPEELQRRREELYFKMKELNGISISPATTKRVDNFKHASGNGGRSKGVRVEAIV